MIALFYGLKINFCLVHAPRGNEETSLTAVIFPPLKCSRLQANMDRLIFNSRLPATFKECDRAVKEAVAKDAWEDVGVIAQTDPTAKRPAAYYKSYETEVTLYGESYRAVVIHSSAHDEKIFIGLAFLALSHVISNSKLVSSLFISQLTILKRMRTAIRLYENLGFKEISL